VKTLRTALVSLFVFTVICGLLYPLALVAAGKVIPAPAPAELVGRAFDQPGQFWGRASATTYDAKTSAGTNLGPSNPALADGVKQRIAALRAADPSNRAPVPIDLVTASASGLDPDISPAAAYYQVPRVAKARGMTADAVRAIVDLHIEERTLGILGERHVNVVRLNEALQAAAPR
jgi:potassium-transporting ATPase KdpC subunit